MSNEKISILLMQDSGTTRRYRVRRSFFRTTLTFLFLCPIFAAASIWLSYKLWEQNSKLTADMAVLNQEYEKTKAIASRLQNLEALLKRENTVEKSIQTSQADAQKNATPAQNTAKNTLTENPAAIPSTRADKAAEGDEILVDAEDNQENFPAIDTKQVEVSKVTSRLMPQGNIRTSLDLRNLGETTLAGDIVCQLALANGETILLEFDPKDAGKYRIQRWKKAVLKAILPPEHDMTNAQLIIEVKDSQNKLLFRNIYPIEQ